MHFVIAADIFPPVSGGPATYAVTLANALHQAGDTVSVVSLTPNSDTSKATCPVYSVTSKIKFVRYAQYFWLLLKQVRYAELVYAMGPVNAGLPALIASKLMFKKCVVKVVGDYAWEQFQNSPLRLQKSDFTSVEDFQNIYPPGKITRFKKIQAFVVRHADLVITPSAFLKKIVLGWGAKEEKIKIVYNAVEVPEVVVQNKPAGEKWIVTAARLVPWKGIDTLIKIMPAILKQFPTAKLKIIGDGPEFDNLKLKVENLKLTASVLLTGNLDKQSTLSYIKSADVFVLNSGYEGLSHVILEAFRLGRTVLASNVGGNPELVRGSEYLFKYNDEKELVEKITRVLEKNGMLDSHDMLHRLNEAAFYTQFNLEKMIATTKLELEKVCAS